MKSKLKSVLAIFASRASPLIIGLLVLPLYKRYGSRSDFDSVSTIFAIQSLAMLLDAGIAQNSLRLSATTAQKHWKCYINFIDGLNAKLVQHYIKIGILFFLYLVFFSKSLNILQSISVSVSLYFISKNNILQSALLGAQRYVESALVQLATNLFRHLFLLTIFVCFSNSIDLNIWLNLGYLVVVDFFVFYLLGRTSNHLDCCGNSKQKMMSNGIAIASISGALAMQGDKLIVGALSGQGQLGEYFLAQTIACIPILFVSTPIAQYFQPQFFKALGEGNREKILDVSKSFSETLFFVCVLPSLAAMWFLGILLDVWIGPGNHSDIARLAGLLLVGTIPGCFGYVLHSILAFKMDYSFLAKVSLALTVTVLSVTATFAGKNLIFVALAYAVYHASSVFILILRIRIKYPEYLILINRRIFTLIFASAILPIFIFLACHE